VMTHILDTKDTKGQLSEEDLISDTMLLQVSCHNLSSNNAANIDFRSAEVIPPFR